MKEYVEGSETSKNSELYLLYRLQNSEERELSYTAISLYIGPGTSKNPKLCPLCRLWDLGERGASRLFLYKGSGDLEKFQTLPFHVFAF